MNLSSATIDIQSAVASGTSFVVPAGSWLLTSWSTGGDFLGFWSGDGAACATFTAAPGDVNPYGYGPEPGVGATVPLSIAPGYLLNISATVSSPADGRGT